MWLYNTRTNAVPVGAQVTDQNGNYQGAGKLPADLSKYQAIDVSLQAIPDPACQRNAACLRRTSAHSRQLGPAGPAVRSMRVKPTWNAEAGATGATGQSPSGPTGP